MSRPFWAFVVALFAFTIANAAYDAIIFYHSFGWNMQLWHILKFVWIIFLFFSGFFYRDATFDNNKKEWTILIVATLVVLLVRYYLFELLLVLFK